MSVSIVPRKPAIILGGRANATSAVRSFGRAGIPVIVISGHNNPAIKSKYVTTPMPIPKNTNPTEHYHKKLIEEDHLPHGSVIFPCDDEAITFVAKHKDQLKRRFRLDIQEPQQQIDLLDKKKTLELASALGVPSPNYWDINTIEDVENCIDKIQFPVLIKPIHSHIFVRHFNRKLILVNDSEQLLEVAHEVLNANIHFMLCEFIPGPDTLLNSYYVYIDENNNRLFEFTKRVIRRAPPNFGSGSYHITEWLPETAEMGYRFFSGIGFKGLGNIEFKTDPRDGQLKVIECNARFTGAQELITRSGLDMPLIIYRYLTEGKRPSSTNYRDFVTLWLPLDDFGAYRILQAEGKISFTQWVKSVFKVHTFSYLNWSDWGPFLADVQLTLQQRSKGALRRLKEATTR